MSVKSNKPVKSPFHQMVPLEMTDPEDDRETDQALKLREDPNGTNVKKTIMLMGFGAIAGLLIATLAVLLGPDNSTESAEPNSCAANTKYSALTLKPLVDRPVAALLKPANLKGERKFEASDITYKDGYYYTVCDSSWAILKVHEDMTIFSDQNEQMGDPTDFDPDNESGFEGLVLDPTTGDFYVVRESIDLSSESDDDDLPANSDARFHAMIMQVDMKEDSFEFTETCPSELQFEGDSKGFEGAISLRGKDGVLYMLGLCEGNFCAEGKKGKEFGNGKVVIMSRQTGDVVPGFSCYWKTEKVIDIPKSAYFQDYSAMSLHRNTKSMAITSQENSQLWVGELVGGCDGCFEVETAQFVEDQGTVYDFPRNDNCEVQYCNIEGIHWVESNPEGDDDTSGDVPRVVAAVSDKMKSKGRQAYTCLPKDQSIHMFAIP